MRQPTAWITKWAARWAGQPRPASRPSPLRVFPLLELLEDRRLLSGLHYLTNQHTDLDVMYSTDDGKLHLAENNKSKDPIKYYKNTKHFVLEFLPEAARPQTSDPRFAFTGAAPGDPVWIVPISPRDPNLLQLGVSGERIDDGVLGAYHETDPRINDVIPFPWIRLNVVDLRGPGYFSVWQTDGFGNPTVWVATAGNPNPDLFFTGPGGHVDYNWCFTAAGDYDVDVQATAYLADGTPVASDVTTYHFQVDPLPRPGAPGRTSSGDATLLPNHLVALDRRSALLPPSCQDAASIVPPQGGLFPQAVAADHVFAFLEIGPGSALARHTTPPNDAADSSAADAPWTDLPVLI